MTDSNSSVLADQFVGVVRRSLSPTSSLTSFVTDSSDEVQGSL